MLVHVKCFEKAACAEHSTVLAVTVFTVFSIHYFSKYVETLIIMTLE